MTFTELLGFGGTLLIVAAYMPQIFHLLKKRCSGGISLTAWLIWLIATSLILVHAITTTDLVFKVLQMANLIAIGTIFILAKKYEGDTCKLHKLYKK